MPIVECRIKKLPKLGYIYSYFVNFFISTPNNANANYSVLLVQPNKYTK